MKHKSGSNPDKRTATIRSIVVSLVVGFVFWIIGELLFPSLTEKMFTPVGMMLYFLIFFLFVAAYGILSNLIKNGEERVGLMLKGSCKHLLVILCVFCVFTGVFEFLYELGDSTIPEPTSFIFVIDDSGSMQGTEQERTDAVNKVMKGSSLPFAVYKFNSQATMLRQMSHYSDKDSSMRFGFASDGGTDIVFALENVVDDFAADKLTGAGNYPKIFLLSDGSSSSRGLNRIVKRCRSLHITITSIGVEGCNVSLLKRIANKTGGGFVYCSDASKLTNGMSQALVAAARRNLLSERFVYKKDALYAVLRILFLSLIGGLWSCLKSILADRDESLFGRFFVLSCICCCLGSVFIEFGAAEQTISFLRLILVLLWAFLPVGKHEAVVQERPSQPSTIPPQMVQPPRPQLDPGAMKIDKTRVQPPLSGDVNRLEGRPFGNTNIGNTGRNSGTTPQEGPPSFNNNKKL